MKFIRSSALWFGLSIALSLASAWLIATYGLRIGIDFQGGQLIEAEFAEPVALNELRTELEDAAREGAAPPTSIAESDAGTYLIRTSGNDEQLSALRQSLTDRVGEWEEIRFENVGPTVGKDLTRKAVLGVLYASIAIILYIAWAFRRVPAPTSSWQFGITAVIALLHDLLITIGAFALFGVLFGFEVDSLFITALLTVLGFSVHDTIVTYDRIRENLLKFPDGDFEEIVYKSIEQTIARSFNTSLTLIIVLLALVLLGGTSIKPFVSAILVGTTAGTYSSILLASQLLIAWQRVLRRKAARA
ncbi:MAG: protein translocase subunit SecF [Patescibacteria group bacterium]|jgi:preprotein translocase subunit SecF